jgi:hemerythrin superfamily protein
LGLGESIKRDHDEYRRYFAKLSKTTQNDGELRKQVFTEFHRKLYAHHAGEDLAIFPEMVKMPALRDLILELEIEHADMKLHFEALSKDRYDVEIWRHKLAPLYDIMHAHWLKEEETLIPFAPDYFTKDEWEQFGKRFDEIVKDYLEKH